MMKVMTPMQRIAIASIRLAPVIDIVTYDGYDTDDEDNSL